MTATVNYERGATFLQTVKLVTEKCCTCGVLFALPYDLQARLIESKATFYCPSGHSQHYCGKTKEQAAREEAERWKRYAKDKEAALRASEGTLRAVRGHRTRLAKKVNAVHQRVGNGVCPCCNRTFKDLAAHMGNKHPEYKDGREAAS